MGDQEKQQGARGRDALMHSGPILDVSRPLWPLVVFPVAFLGGGWLIEVIGGWL